MNDLIMYDIYLIKFPESDYESSDLDLQCKPENIPCFLELNMPAEAVADIEEMISLGGGKGIIVKSDYRSPKLSLSEVFSIANIHLNRQAKKNFPSYSFRAIQCIRSEPMYWLFGSFSEQLIHEGHNPGGVTVAIDKLDGHIWTEEEKKLVLGEEFFFEGTTEKSIEEISTSFTRQLGLSREKIQNHRNEIQLYHKGLKVCISQHNYPKLIFKQYGITPRIHISFRVNPSGNKVARSLMIELLVSILDCPGDGILLRDKGCLILLAKKISGKLLLFENNEAWIKAMASKLSERI
ncbi:hypothetical protein [Synechococcus sp. PCC 7336]|uniref:hypothetical protein n=1 Tax=Synechococcus sp. PCC 7336 TaxID=195250 RepID=UPI0003472D77|nr:hypothetical protein [Synechococcus sp. PCC 7336]